MVTLPANQAKYGHPKGKQSHNDVRDRHAKRSQTIKKEKQN
jgi:hypothetical protein